jgi:hypothetical protein
MSQRSQSYASAITPYTAALRRRVSQYACAMDHCPITNALVIERTFPNLHLPSRPSSVPPGSLHQRKNSHESTNIRRHVTGTTVPILRDPARCSCSSERTVSRRDSNLRLQLLSAWVGAAERATDAYQSKYGPVFLARNDLWRRWRNDFCLAEMGSDLHQQWRNPSAVHCPARCIPLTKLRVGFKTPTPARENLP